jgi:DNA polymerase (family X)
MTTQKSELAAIFTSMAGLLASRNENPFKVRAYRRAAETLRNLPDELSDVNQRGELQTLPGIGKDLAKKIEEYLSTGRIRAYEELKTPLPDAAREWLTLPGFSEPIVHDLFFRLGMRNWDDLEALARSHLLETLPGFSGRSEEVVQAISRRMAGKDSQSIDRNA